MCVLIFVNILLDVSALGVKNTKHITAAWEIVVSQKQRLLFLATAETQQAKGLKVSCSVKWLSDLLITYIREHICK